MKINIYYGGRGLAEDPVLFGISRVEEVLKDLSVETKVIHLYKEQEQLDNLVSALEGVDGIVLAVPLTWIGIGGYMQSFLDACWLQGDKQLLKEIFMFPLVLSSTYGERDAENHLIKSWEHIGGKTTNGICGYVKDSLAFQTNAEYAESIEKKVEYFYRIINQKPTSLPTSAHWEVETIEKSTTVPVITSPFATDDVYVQKQKEDIEELSVLFKQMLSEKGTDIFEQLKRSFENNFVSVMGFKAAYQLNITDKNKSLIIEIDDQKMDCYYGIASQVDVTIQGTYDVIHSIQNGKLSFQRAFLTGALTAKGNFKNLYTLDQLFNFQK